MVLSRHRGLGRENWVNRGRGWGSGPVTDSEDLLQTGYQLRAGSSLAAAQYVPVPGPIARSCCDNRKSIYEEID